jgi:glycerate-2-kinase
VTDRPVPESPTFRAFEAAYRGAVTGADAYRGVRFALRRDGAVLRLGNRFVRLEHVRDVAFVAVGSAATSLALGAVAALDERITQGLVAGPDPVPDEVPFRSLRISPRRSPRDATGEAGSTLLELAGELTDVDLLLVLLSPGALFDLALPPAGVTADDWGAWIEELHRSGATSAEIARFVRVVGSGAVGGALAARTRAHVTTLVVARSDGGALVGGGPTWPVAPRERDTVRAFCARYGLLTRFPRPVRAALEPGSTPAIPAHVHRPVVICDPAEAMREASSALAERRWTPRLADMRTSGGPETAAETFVAQAERLARNTRVLGEERESELAAASAGDREIGLPPGFASAIRRGGAWVAGPRASHGLAVFSSTTLDVPEGLDGAAAERRFLAAAAGAIHYRGFKVALLRTSGGAPDDPAPPGVFVSAADGWQGSAIPRDHSLAMRAGVTDVGYLLVGLFPRADAPKAAPS